MMTNGVDRVGRWVRHPVAVATTIALLLSLAVSLQVVRERRYPSFTPDTQVLYVPSAGVLDRMALSFDSVLADLYWIRALQHYGGTRGASGDRKGYELLYPLLDITTSLDPRFNIAYRFGAIFLTESYPDGPGRPDQAVALLQKGSRQMPARWEYLMDIGFVHYWWLHDYEEAARWFLRASEIPGASWWLRSLAANTLELGGSRDASRVLWQQIHDTADDQWRRDESLRRLMQLDALDAIDELTIEAERFAALMGRWPEAWQDLVDAGRLSQPPLDSFEYPFALDPSARLVGVSSQSPLWPLPDEPPGMLPQ